MSYIAQMENLPELNKATGKAIRELRKKSGLNQAQLAGLAGLSEDYISNLERGIQSGTLSAIYHISTALRMDISEMVLMIEKKLKS